VRMLYRVICGCLSAAISANYVLQHPHIRILPPAFFRPSLKFKHRQPRTSASERVPLAATVNGTEFTNAYKQCGCTWSERKVMKFTYLSFTYGWRHVCLRTIQFSILRSEIEYSLLKWVVGIEIRDTGIDRAWPTMALWPMGCFVV